MSCRSPEGAPILRYAVAKALFAEERIPMKRRIIMAGTTFFLAAATGHVMQNGNAIVAKLRGTAGSAQPAAEATPPVPAAAPAVAQATTTPTAAVLVANTSALPIAPTSAVTTPAVPVASAPAAKPAAASTGVATATPAITPAVASAPAAVRPAGSLPDLPVIKAKVLDSGTVLAARMDAVSDKYQRPKTDADEDYSVFGIPCGTSKLDLSLGARGTLKAVLAAPCHPEERVVFSHAGLSFTLLTDAAGNASVTIPAMATDAKVDAGFASGEVLSAERNVPDLETLRRVALSGGGELRLNAFENGAARGADGHYSIERSGDPTAADSATVVTLGDATMEDAKVVEVYTASAGAKSVEIEADGLATADSCGRTAKARIISMVAGKPGMNEVLSQAMPSCDALGDMVQTPLPGWDGPLTVATSQ